jgi:hypothetical protein
MIGPELVQVTRKKIKIIKDRMKVATVRKKKLSR